jgi:hypothetical protein
MTEEDTAEIRSEVAAQIALQKARKDAYDQGEYELDEWEGFTCTECGWRGLNAPMNDEPLESDTHPDDFSLTMCPTCETPGPETSDEHTRWHLVVRKLIDSDVDLEVIDDGE